jgi:ribosome maturation factor RimP
MQDPQLIDQIKEAIAPEFQRKGICLVEINKSYQGRILFLRFIVDKTGSAVTLGECASLNRQIGMILDERNLIEDRYILEVCSPGLDRPLKTKDDFTRCQGRRVKFFLIQPINGKIEIDGLITEVSEDGVKADTAQAVLTIPFSQIQQAKQLI